MVVDIALFHLQQVSQLFRGIQCVAHPRDVAQVVFLSFVNAHEDVHCAVVVLADAVFHNHGVAITQFVVFVDNELFVGFVVLFYELLRAEEVYQFALLVRLFHNAFQLLCRQRLVANDLDVVHLDFFFLVDLDVYNDLVLVLWVILLVDEYLCILKALVVKVAFDERLGAVDDVRSNLSAFYHADSFFQIFAFGLFYARIANFGHTGTHGQVDGQPYFAVFFLVVCDADVGEQTMLPITFAGLRDFIAGDGDGLSLGQTGQADDDIIFVVVRAFHLDVGNLQFPRCSRVEDYRRFLIVGFFYRLS